MSARAPLHALSAAEQQRVEALRELSRRAAIPELCAALADPSWAVRREVVAALATLGDEAVPALSALLRDERGDEAVIAAAVDTLSASTGPSVDEAVIALAGASSPAVAADAAQILGRRRSAAAVPVLSALSRSENDNVAVAAIEALGRIGGRASIDALVDAAGSGNFFRTFPAIDVLGSSGDPRAVAPLAALLASPSYAPEAARALGRTGDKNAVAPLTALLAQGGDRTARIAATALAELHDRHGERYGVTLALDRALGGASSPVIVRRLTHALAGAAPAEQAALCQVLGALGDESAEPFLIRLLDAPAPVGPAAAQALQRLGRGSGAQILAALRDGDSARRLLLLPLVTARTGTALELARCLDDPSAEVRAMACDALARAGNPAAVPALFPLLADPSPRVAQAALGAIQSLDDEQAEALTLAAARSPDLQMRRAALRIVAYFGYASALDLVIEIVDDAGSDERLREAALHALSFLEDPRAIEALLGAVRHPNARTRGAAMRALGQCGAAERAAPALQAGLSDPDTWVRYYACLSLGKLAWEPAAASIAALLADRAELLHVAAVEALSHLRGAGAFRALCDACQSPQADVQRAALVGVGVSRNEAALPILLEALGSPEAPTRLMAISAIANFDTPQVVPALGRAADDADEGVRTAALGFLASRATLAATAMLVDLLGRGAPAERILAALSVPSNERIAGLLAALATADDALAARLASALARMHRAEAVEALAQALSLPNVAARRAAAIALAAIGTPLATEALRGALAREPDPEVRQICVLELAQQ